METLLFWVLPALMLLIGLRGKLLAGWRLFFCSAAALYLGFWIAPSWYNRLDFLPPGVAEYRFGIAVTFGFVFIFALLHCVAANLAGKDDDFGFPAIPMMVLNAVFRFGFGVVLSTLLFMLCATTPLRGLPHVNGDGVQAGANAAMLHFTAVCDKLTGFAPPTPRAESLERVWFPQRQDEEENREEDENADGNSEGDAKSSANPADPAAPTPPDNR